MATIVHLPARRGARASGRPAPAAQETAWRLGAAALLTLAAATFVIGTSWDIQWHAAVGRDRTLTLPHVLMIGGIAVAGLVSLALILLDTGRARLGGAVHPGNSSRMFRVFQAPVGLALAGFGALLAVIAFPLDDYWHTLYGIDVTLWAPFHVMLGFSVVMIEIGTLYVIASEMNRMAPGRARTLTGAGLASSLAVALSTILIFIVQGDASQGLAVVGSYEFVIYPVLLALMLPVGLVSAALITRRPGAATLLALVFLVLRQAMYVFVPWAMDITVAAENLSYRPHAPQGMITPFAFPTGILLAGLLIDAVLWLARRQGSDGMRRVLAAGALTALLVTLTDQPWSQTLRGFYPALDMTAAYLAALPFAVIAALAGVGLAVLLSRGLAAIRN